MAEDKFYDNDDDFDKKRLEAPADFDGPTSRRRCTDILFALLLLVMWVGMTGIGVFSWKHGDIDMILRPMDWAGNICGKDTMENFPNIVYVNKLLGGVCVKECPKVENQVDVHTLVTYNGIYQGKNATLDADFLEVADYSARGDLVSCDENMCPTNPQFSWFSRGINQGLGFATYAVDTIEIVGNRCIRTPKASIALYDNITTDSSIAEINSGSIISSLNGFYQHLYGDLYQARGPIMIFGILVAMVIGFTYAMLLRIQPVLTIMIWGSIFSTIGIVLGSGLYVNNIVSEWKVADPQVYSDQNILAAQIGSYALFIIAVVLALVTISMRQQIMLSMACVRAAGRALACMPTMMVFPVFQVIGLASFLGMWIFYAVHLASIGHTVEEDMSDFTNTTNVNEDTSTVQISTFEIDDFPKKCGWYLLFSFFWTIAFISAMGEIIIAMTISKWYFTRDKRRVGASTVFGCIYESIRYHIGTAAFGSFVIAVIQMIKTIVAKMQKKARELDNKFGQMLLCCLQCCICCFEKFLKFLNKNAYIQTAIFGTPFCRSAREAFSLIVRNAGKVASISYVSTVVLFVGKIFISSLTTAAAYIYIDREMAVELYSYAGPCILVFIISYVIGDMFLSIFDMSTSTILQCYVADEEMFDGDDCYAEHELRNWLNDFEEEEKKLVAGQ
eukprot:CAMPEP_0194085270 /NCGR_PEP_ID=MMETSP0149-20130528/16925_1 /TAXON_ID=122233 /ORGANISM="Chaetoceros debilis, Strain MM31A-1" /LENGTH=672 /DNA_ID=CAMNT_0038768117 /DNA_START=64 /DNA_END=2082 /DNA_ORIENTATION=-